MSQAHRFQIQKQTYKQKIQTQNPNHTNPTKKFPKTKTYKDNKYSKPFQKNNVQNLFKPNPKNCNPLTQNHFIKNTQ